MTRKRSFPIRSGYCHLFEDRIEIEGQGLSARLQKWFAERGLRSMWVFYFLLFLLLLGSGLIALSIENYFLSTFFGAFALIALVALWQRRNIAFSPVIPREQISAVIYHSAVAGQSRARFEIRFQVGKRSLKRWIYLPGSAQNGASIAQSAQVMMREEGLLAEGT